MYIFKFVLILNYSHDLRPFSSLCLQVMMGIIALLVQVTWI